MQLWFLMGLASAIQRLGPGRAALVGGPDRISSPEKPLA